MVSQRIQLGERRMFAYQCLESDESNDAELWHRTMRPAVVLKKLSGIDEGEVGRMFHVRFDDGYEGDVFEYELGPITKRISRSPRRPNPPILGPRFEWPHL
jgi:hypothetical protein